MNQPAPNPATQETVIFCTKTATYVDIVPPGEDPYIRLAKHIPQYGNDLAMLTTEEAYRRHEEHFKTDPEEITAERFQEMLNILPPVGWRNTSNGEVFRMSEHLAGNITSIFVRIGERYVTFADRRSMPHEECCRRAFEYLRARPLK